MNCTNYITTVVKLLESPKYQLLNNKFNISKIRVQLPQKRKKTMVHLYLWGEAAYDVAKHYNKNDYFLVEGLASLHPLQKRKKQIRITASKVYPIFLNSKNDSKG